MRGGEGESSLLLVGNLDDGVDLAVVVAIHQLRAHSQRSASLLDNHSSSLEPGLEHVGLNLNHLTSLTKASSSAIST